LRHGAEQAADATALGEMLVDYHVADQPEPRRHVQIADAVRFLARALDQHRLAHHRSAGRGPCDHAAAQMDFADHLLDPRVADLARDAQLVAAGEEDARRVFEDVRRLLVQRLAALIDVELDEIVETTIAKRLLIGVEIALGDRAPVPFINMG
jgi:hypothetical protein